jgi:hypothetical protein
MSVAMLLMKVATCLTSSLASMAYDGEQGRRSMDPA